MSEDVVEGNENAQLEEELDIPTFKRKLKREAHEKLRLEAADLVNLGGSFSKLDPIHPEDLKGTGVVTRPMRNEDITTISSDTDKISLDGLRKAKKLNTE